MRLKRIAVALAVAVIFTAAGSLLAEPKILKVDSLDPSSPGTSYKYEDVIRIVVHYDAAVDVYGFPQLTLETAGWSNSVAIFDHTGGTTGLMDLYFKYTVAKGDVSERLNYPDINSLWVSELGGTTAIVSTGQDKDDPAYQASVELPGPLTPNSLGSQTEIRVQAEPVVTFVSSATPGGTKTVGDEVEIRVSFSDKVKVTTTGDDVPTIELETSSSSNVYAYYESGSETTNLIFRYKVGNGQHSDHLSYVAGAIHKPDGCVMESFGHNILGSVNVDLALPSSDGSGRSLYESSSIKIDTPALVSKVRAVSGDGRFGLDNIIKIGVKFTAKVKDNGTDPATLLLNVGSSSNVYAYRTASDAGPGSNEGEELFFEYHVGGDQFTTHLDYLSVVSLEGDIIKTAVPNGVTTVLLTLPAHGDPNSLGGSSEIEIDTIPPHVDAYMPLIGEMDVESGEPFVLFFDENITKDTGEVQGSGHIEVRQYDDDSLLGTVNVTHTNVVVEDNIVTIYFGTTLESETHYYVTVPDTAFCDDLTNWYAGISDKTWHFTSADTEEPHVTRVTSTTPNGHYKAGDQINVRVEFNEIVNYDGMQRMRLGTGGNGRDAVIHSHAADETYMDFLYTVEAGDNADPLQYLSTTALSNMPYAWVRDLSGNDADLTLPDLTSLYSLAGNKHIIIDTMPPRVLNVTSTNDNGLYTTNTLDEQTIINVRVQFSEQVEVSGTPSLLLDTGGAGRPAVYVSGDGSATLTFEYTVEPGDFSTNLNYGATNAFTHSYGGYIRDQAGNDALMGLPPVASGASLGGNKEIVIDTIRPEVRNVTSTNANGHYRAGVELDVRMEISKPVTIDLPTPYLTLNSGPTARALFVEIVDDTNMVFSYTIAPGENSPALDYISEYALDLMAAKVIDAAGNPLTTNLALPGYFGSLSANRTLVIDTVPPTVSVVSDSTTPTNGSPILFIATFNETVSNLNVSAINVVNGSVVPSNFSGQVGTVFRFHVIPSGLGQELVQIVEVTLAAGAAQDLAGNPSEPSATASRIYDTVRPVGIMSSTSDNPTDISPINVSILFNEVMYDFHSGCLRATNAAIINFAGSGASYSFQLIPFHPGIVRANIDEGVAHDLAGNRCFPSAAFVREYVFPASTWLSASDGLYTDRVALEWAPVSGAVAYRVIRNRTKDPYFAELVGIADQGPHYDDTTVTPGTPYYYWVQPINEYGGIGLFCEPDTGWRGLIAPLNLSATDGAYNDRIVITWDALDSATGYELYRSRQPALETATLIASPTRNSYTDMNVELGFYYYWVRAVSAFGKGPLAGPESGWRIAFADALNNSLLDWRSGGSNDWFVQTAVTHDGVAAAQSGAIRDNCNSWIETIAYGPGTLGFWWRVSCETNWDILRFTINGVSHAEMHGESGWQHLMFDLPEGTNVLRWNYIKDHSRSEGADAGWLDEVTYAEIPRYLVASDGVYSDRVRLTWFGSFVPGTTYRIYRNAVFNPALAIPVGETMQSWFDDVSVVPGRVYYYWVQANNLHGNSSLGDYDQGHARQVAYDFNADGLSDLAVYNRDTGAWYITTLTGTVLAFGLAMNEPDKSPFTIVPADYDGDGAVDVGVYHEATGAWFVKTVANGQALLWGSQWGGPGCTPVPGDYDGDGRADMAVFDRTTGFWYAWLWSGKWGMRQWGWPGAEPYPADYNGDGCTDLAVFNRATGQWYVRSYLTENVLVWGLSWGWNTAVVVPADYDGDGKADFGVFDAATGLWYVLGANHEVIFWAVPWGAPGMIPAPADYDGDGRADLAVYNPDTGNWYIWTWSGLAYTDLRWGVPPMKPALVGQ